MLKTSTTLLNVFTDTIYVNNFTQIPTPIMGEFAQKIAIYIDTASNTENHIALLTNMLKACKLGMQDCYLYIINNSATETIPIFKEIKPNIVISFGVPIANEMMNLFLRKNDIIDFNGAQILLTTTLQNLQNTPAEKNALWQALQKLFKLA